MYFFLLLLFWGSSGILYFSWRGLGLFEKIAPAKKNPDWLIFCKVSLEAFPLKLITYIAGNYYMQHCPLVNIGCTSWFCLLVTVKWPPQVSMPTATAELPSPHAAWQQLPPTLSPPHVPPEGAPRPATRRGQSLRSLGEGCFLPPQRHSRPSLTNTDPGRPSPRAVPP